MSPLSASFLDLLLAHGVSASSYRSGGSIRSLPGLPSPLTKQFTGLFCSAECKSAQRRRAAAHLLVCSRLTGCTVLLSSKPVRLQLASRFSNATQKFRFTALSRNFLGYLMFFNTLSTNRHVYYTIVLHVEI